MLIGTAGHIDHGKTTLVQALTGVDTTHLPEERARGITIELGYAYSPLQVSDGDGRMLAFIDVPGHERFVPTMLMGAAGIDYALLVVAADDGVMPQTREHLAIVHLLGIARGAVAITKCDRVSSGRVAQVQAEVQALMAGTRLADSSVFPVSAVSGMGVGPLRAHLDAVAAAEMHYPQAAGFRLVVDRRFSLAGAGTIVTGTVLAGQVREGDSVQLIRPDGWQRDVRVRGLRVNNCPARLAGPGSRCAVNLSGVDYRDIERGDWVLAPGPVRATDRLDVRLQLLPEAPRKLTQWSSVTLHHAGGHAMARLVLLDAALEAGGLAPGGAALVQAVLDRPVLACCTDRVVIRDAAGRETLGGAVVLDPFPPARHRRRPERLALLQALEEADPAKRLHALVQAAPLGVDAQTLMLAHNIPGNALPGLLPDVQHVQGRGGTHVFSRKAWERLGEAVVDRLALHHQAFEDEPGVERERLRRMCAPRLPSPVFLARLEALLDAGRVARAGSAWHLPGHAVELSSQDRERADALSGLLVAGVFNPPWVRDLAAACVMEEAQVRSLLRKMAMRGEVFQVVRDLFYPRATVIRLCEIALVLAQAHEGRIRAADLRDIIGGGRKRAIQVLEFLDRVGFTRKVGSGQQVAHCVRGDPPVEEVEVAGKLA